MKLKILIVVQFLIIIFFVLLAKIKSHEAEDQMIKAEELSELVLRNEERANDEARRAEKMAVMVIETQTALEKCQSGN